MVKDVSSFDAEVVVIGAGVVGLAVAAELARECSVVVVERHESVTVYLIREME